MRLFRAASAATWHARAVALLTAAMGVVNLFSATMPALQTRVVVLRPYLPLEVRHASHLAAALAGFALLVLAQGLWRRKHAACYLTVAVLAASAVSHLLKGLDYEEAILASALAVYLVSIRGYFYARSDSPSVRHGLSVLAGAVLFTLAYGVIGFYLLDRHFKVDFDVRGAVAQTVALFTSSSGAADAEPTTRFGRWFADSIYLVAAGTTGYSLLALLRPVLQRAPAGDAERRQAKQIVEAHGRSSLARFLLFDDKSYFFSRGGSVIGYALVGRTAVALGDPVGPWDDAGRAIRAFTEFCRRNDWTPAFFQTLPDHLSEYREAGFDVLCVGHEAVVDLENFSLSGKAMKSLRGNVSRLRRDGYVTELLSPPHPEPLMEELRAVSDEWLAGQHGGEKRFSLGWFDDDYLQDGPILAVRTPEGGLSAFANVIPEYQIPESTIDLMRKRSAVANGTMDLLFVALFEWAKENGFTTFNLGLSPLAGVGERPDDPAVERAVRFIYEHLNQFYNFKGLYDYKAKFQPTWSPRYLIYPGAASLPTVALAVIRADNGDQPLWKYLK
jgi:phosphatidylglycerol lysyltransferase